MTTLHPISKSLVTIKQQQKQHRLGHWAQLLINNVIEIKSSAHLLREVKKELQC